MARDYASEKAWEAKQKYISSTGGKGSVRRKTDEEKYRDNYDKIFGKRRLEMASCSRKRTRIERVAEKLRTIGSLLLTTKELLIRFY